ncbi:MAG: SRPBCC domain-containing protein [Sorangiineae bacterium]|nr:SRPBCC domain-containing protein [Polyangiaceae bacterium]MEB2324128.1 SRPBCC domain-containing protein [Sorangiineae bacterium]
MIRLEQRVTATAGEVWEACATPEGLARWQADEVKGSVTPGGTLELAWPGLGAALTLEIAELDRHRRITFEGGGARVTLALAPGKLLLEHTEPDSEEERAGVTSSWRVSLALLAHALERHPGRERRVTWFAQPARVSSETLHVYFTAASALGGWLARRGSVGSEGSRYQLELAGGAPMSGRVLANVPGRDVALEWEEDGGSTLVLRSLPSPLVPRERLIVLGWSRFAVEPAEPALAREVASALARLARLVGGGVTA